VKTLHRPRLMPIMVALSGISSLWRHRCGAPSPPLSVLCIPVVRVALFSCYWLDDAHRWGDVDVGAVAGSPPPFCFEVFECRLCSFGRFGRRLVWTAALGWCVAFYVVSVFG
jgi:hypothetical protein